MKAAPWKGANRVAVGGALQMSLYWLFIAAAGSAYGGGGVLDESTMKAAKRKASGEIYCCRDVMISENGSLAVSPAWIVVDQQVGAGGHFTSLQHAIDSIPQGNRQWVHILVRAGLYLEKITIPYTKPYIVIQGEGRLKTIITWHDRASTSSGTANSATFSANAPYFVAKSITFMNIARPPLPGENGGQAVAALLTGDMMAFYQCGFHGSQDTLFDYQGRHYFKNCYIEGSIDFIFGHGQSIYSGCSLVVKAQPGYISGSITAQKRDTPFDTSGFVFINCYVYGIGQVYLGRAWGAYSMVIFLYTYMSEVVTPQGWDDWGIIERQRTVFYGQYKCYGTGASLLGRVPWSHELTDDEARPFLDLNFINGIQWLLNI